MRGAFCVLLALGIALGPFGAGAQAAVNGGSASTDRPGYVVGMAVNAAATFTFSGSPNNIEDRAFVEWRLPDTTPVAPGRWITAVAPPGNGEVAFQDSWVSGAAGLGYSVSFRTNLSTSDSTPMTAAATYDVGSPQDTAIATDLAVRTPPFVENNTAITATVSMTDFPAWVWGNATRLGSVNFTWLSPSLAPVHWADLPVSGGVARDTWWADSPGAGYQVVATYLGADPVSNTTSFEVLPTTLHARDVPPGEFVFWPQDPRPWRICGDLRVADGGTLMIEAGTTVVFCPGARMLVSGTLTVQGTAAAPVRFTPYAPAPAPGAWGGILIEATSGTNSVLHHLVVEDATDGITVLGASPSIYGTRVERGTGVGVRLSNSSAVLVGITIAGFPRGVQAIQSEPFVLGLSVDGAVEGIELVDSRGSWEEIRVSGALDNAVNITRSDPRVRGLVVEDPRDVGVDLACASTQVLTGGFVAVNLTGGDTSVRMKDCYGLTFEGASLQGASRRALDLTRSTATFSNSTITSLSSTGEDLVLLVSTLYLVNSPMDESRRLSISSTLWVQNFLHVQTVDEGGRAVAGTSVVLRNDVESWVRSTGSDGALRWQVVTDHRILPNGATVASVTNVSVAKAGWETLDPARLLDMSSAQTSTFRLWKIVPPPVYPINASFTYEATDLSVAFEDGSTPTTGYSLVFWLWDFGDGSSSSARSPTHEYTVAGTHRVQLLVVDTFGRSDLATANVTVVAPAVPNDVDADGMPNAWELEYGLDPSDATDAGADLDADNYTNLQEYQVGTDPSNPSSHPGDTVIPPGNSSEFPTAWLIGAEAAGLAVVSVLLLLPAWRRRRRAGALEGLEFQKGKAYVILDKRPDAAFRHLAREARAGGKGLGISRSAPEGLRRKYGLGQASLRWLSRSAGEDHLMPTNLGAILKAADAHLAANPGGLVVLDGLEYLLVENEFPKVVRFLNRLAGAAAIRGGVVLVPFDLDGESPQREATLTKGYEVI